MFDDTRDAIVERASRAGIEFDVTSGPTYPDKRLLLKLPNGTKTRDIFVSIRGSAVLAGTEFEHWTVLGNLCAVWDKLQRILEVEIRNVSRAGPPGVRILRSLPGVENLSSSVLQTSLFDDVDDGDVEQPESRAVTAFQRPDSGPWRMLLSSDGAINVEISSISNRLMLLGGRPIGVRIEEPGRFASIKVFDVDFNSHDEALGAAEELSRSVTFDLDVCYGVSFDVVRLSPGRVMERRATLGGQAPFLLPRRRYVPEAIALYSFGRSAVGMPIQQYLAYYQTLEYFFPSFWERDQLRRVRAELADPRFRPDDDNRLARIIQIVRSSGGRGGVNEREQLAKVIDNCITGNDLREFIENDATRKASLVSKRALRGVPPFALMDRSRPLASQAADRIYAIRCRIVHGKEDVGGDLAPPLLPFSEEEGRLRHDVDLVQLLAQKVIVASSSSNCWWTRDQRGAP